MKFKRFKKNKRIDKYFDFVIYFKVKFYLITFINDQEDVQFK